MKSLKLLTLAACALLFSECKTTVPTGSSRAAPSLLEVQQILDTMAEKFLQYADSTSGDPWKAIMLTANWVQSLPNVQSVSTIDSTYLDNVLKSGSPIQYSLSFLDIINFFSDLSADSILIELKEGIAQKYAISSISGLSFIGQDKSTSIERIKLESVKGNNLGQNFPNPITYEITINTTDNKPC